MSASSNVNENKKKAQEKLDKQMAVIGVALGLVKIGDQTKGSSKVTGAVTGASAACVEAFQGALDSQKEASAYVSKHATAGVEPLMFNRFLERVSEVKMAYKKMSESAVTPAVSSATATYVWAIAALFDTELIAKEMAIVAKEQKDRAAAQAGRINTKTGSVIAEARQAVKAGTLSADALTKASASLSSPGGRLNVASLLAGNAGLLRFPSLAAPDSGSDEDEAELIGSFEASDLGDTGSVIDMGLSLRSLANSVRNQKFEPQLTRERAQKAVFDAVISKVMPSLTQQQRDEVYNIGTDRVMAGAGVDDIKLRKQVPRALFVFPKTLVDKYFEGSAKHGYSFKVKEWYNQYSTAADESKGTGLVPEFPGKSGYSAAGADATKMGNRVTEAAFDRALAAVGYKDISTLTSISVTIKESGAGVARYRVPEGAACTQSNHPLVIMGQPNNAFYSIAASNPKVRPELDAMYKTHMMINAGNPLQMLVRLAAKPKSITEGVRMRRLRHILNGIKPFSPDALVEFLSMFKSRREVLTFGASFNQPKTASLGLPVTFGAGFVSTRENRKRLHEGLYEEFSKEATSCAPDRDTIRALLRKWQSTDPALFSAVGKSKTETQKFMFVNESGAETNGWGRPLGTPEEEQAAAAAATEEEAMPEGEAAPKATTKKEAHVSVAVQARRPRIYYAFSYFLKMLCFPAHTMLGVSLKTFKNLLRMRDEVDLPEGTPPTVDVPRYGSVPTATAVAALGYPVIAYLGAGLQHGNSKVLHDYLVVRANAHEQESIVAGDDGLSIIKLADGSFAAAALDLNNCDQSRDKKLGRRQENDQFDEAFEPAMQRVEARARRNKWSEPAIKEQQAAGYLLRETLHLSLDCITATNSVALFYKSTCYTPPGYLSGGGVIGERNSLDIHDAYDEIVGELPTAATVAELKTLLEEKLSRSEEEYGFSIKLESISPLRAQPTPAEVRAAGGFIPVHDCVYLGHKYFYAEHDDVLTIVGVLEPKRIYKAMLFKAPLSADSDTGEAPAGPGALAIALEIANLGMDPDIRQVCCNVLEAFPNGLKTDVDKSEVLACDVSVGAGTYGKMMPTKANLICFAGFPGTTLTFPDKTEEESSDVVKKSAFKPSFDEPAPAAEEVSGVPRGAGAASFMAGKPVFSAQAGAEGKLVVAGGGKDKKAHRERPTGSQRIVEVPATEDEYIVPEMPDPLGLSVRTRLQCATKARLTYFTELLKMFQSPSEGKREIRAMEEQGLGSFSEDKREFKMHSTSKIGKHDAEWYVTALQEYKAGKATRKQAVKAGKTEVRIEHSATKKPGAGSSKVFEAPKLKETAAGKARLEKLSALKAAKASSMVVAGAGKSLAHKRTRRSAEAADEEANKAEHAALEDEAAADTAWERDQRAAYQAEDAEAEDTGDRKRGRHSVFKDEDDIQGAGLGVGREFVDDDVE